MVTRETNSSRLGKTETSPYNTILSAMPFNSDEPHFYISDTVNKQNNPLEIHRQPLRHPKAIVWCALSSTGIVGPYFFEEYGSTFTGAFNRY